MNASDGRMEMNRERRFWIEFLQIYKNKPELWNTKSENYKNRSMKNRSYQMLIDKCKELDPTADKEFVAKKINSFRSTYRREMKKVEARQSAAGTEDDYVPTLWYYKHLSFLKDQEESVEGESYDICLENEEYKNPKVN